MYRRFLAALLSLILCVTSLPCAAAEGGYGYPAVDITFPADDQIAVEMAFRQWAAELLYDYYAGTYKAYYGGVSGREPFAEYYRLAKLKEDFDRENQDDKDIVYNVVSGAEEDKQGVYAWVLLESLKETAILNSEEILADFKTKPEKERVYYMVDMESGELVVDEYVVDAQERSENTAALAWATVISDAVVMIGEGIAQFHFAVPNGGDLKSKVISMVADAVDSLSETLIKGAETNLLNESRNTVRNLLAADLAEQLASINTKAVGFLRNTYSDLNSVDEAYRPLITSFLSALETKNSVLQKEIAMAAENKVTSLDEVDAAKQILDDAGYEIAQIIDTGSLLQVALLAAVGDLLQGLVELGLDPVKEHVSDKEYTFSIGKSKATLSAASFIDALKDILKTYIDVWVDDTIEQYYVQYMEGTSLDENLWSMAFENLYATFGTKEFVSELVTELALAFLPDEAELVKSADEQSILKMGIDVMDEAIASILNDQKDVDVLNVIVKWATDEVKNRIQSEIKSLQLDKNIEENKLKGQTKKHNENMAQGYKGRKLDAQGGVIQDISKHQVAVNNLQAQIDQKTFDFKMVETLANVWDSVLETATSLTVAVDSTVSQANGEGRVSLLAARVHAARKMSEPMLDESRELIEVDMGFPEEVNLLQKEVYSMVLDRELIALEDLVAVVSRIHSQMKYDAVGTLAYYDISLHFYENEEYLFMLRVEEDEIKYNKLLSWGFMRYVFDHYENVEGNNLLLTVEKSDDYYNKIVNMKDRYFEQDWDPAWEAYFQ